MEMNKQILDKQIFAGPRGTMGNRVDFAIQALLQVCPSTPSPDPLQRCLVDSSLLGTKLLSKFC